MAQPHSVENNPNILDVPPDADEVGLVVRVAGSVATTGGGGPSTVTADQGDPNTNANGWPVKITDGVDTVEVSSLGELLAIVNQGTSPWVVSGTVAVSSLPEPVSVDDNGGSLTVDGTVAVSNFPATQPVSGTVDTELPAAAVLGDADANPTAPFVAAALMGLNGVGTWTRIPLRAAQPLTTISGLIVRSIPFNFLDYDTGAGTANEKTVGLVVPASGGPVAVPGDVTNGLDVDVTRVQGNVAVTNADLTSLLLEARITSGAMAMQVDDASVGVGTTYQGWAEPGTTTATGTWRIRRIVQTGAADSDYSITFADGNRNFDNVWDNRTGLAYS